MAFDMVSWNTRGSRFTAEDIIFEGRLDMMHLEKWIIVRYNNTC